VSRTVTRWHVLVYSWAIFIFALVLVFPTPEGLTPEGQRCLAIFCLSIILWVTNVIPMSVTSLFAIVLLPLFGVLSSKQAFSLFGNPAVFFILGALILSAALMQSGLSARLALTFLSWFRGSPGQLLSGILISSAFLAFWMPEHAVAAMMFPIVLEIGRSLKLKPTESRYGKALFLSLAWGAIIGGVATYLGGARNPLALALLNDRYGITIGFLEWMVAIVPLVLLMVIAARIAIRIFLPVDVDDVRSAERVLLEDIRKLGKVSLQEKKVAAVAVMTILAWVFASRSVGLANIAVLSAVSLFLVRAVDWKQVESNVNWGVILMYGGAIALGDALHTTGAAHWVVVTVFSHFAFSAFAVVVLLSLVAKLLTEGISNAAAVAVLLPLAFSLGDDYGVSPQVMTFAVAVPAGLAFCLPIGTPPNAICFSSGYYRVRDAVRVGIFLNLISWLIFAAILKFYWPLIGLTLVGTE
jgi:sodium-dependent dicarboxylate transporter 2/3/5